MSRTSFCSGRRSITGYGVSGSNSVELAPSMSTTCRANSDTATCIPRQMPRNGTSWSREVRRADLALHAAHAEAARNQDAVALLELALGFGTVEPLGVHPAHIDLRAVMDAAVPKRLDHRQVGVLE